MLLESLILAISSSIDSLGIGITYGIKNIKICFYSKLLLFIISLVITYISVFLGNILNFVLPKCLSKIFGSTIIILIGIFICYQSQKKKNKCSNIFNNPTCSDFDKSNTIDSKESLFLAIALSIDSFCIGIGASIINVNFLLFPIFVSFFQVFFIIVGNLLGNFITKLYKLPENLWSLISGFLLILIGFLSFLF